MKKTYELSHPETGEAITVTAVFCKGYAQTMEDPGEPDSAEIHAVLNCEGMDICDDLTDDQLLEIENAWLGAYYDDRSAYFDSIYDAQVDDYILNY